MRNLPRRTEPRDPAPESVRDCAWDARISRQRHRGRRGTRESAVRAQSHPCELELAAGGSGWNPLTGRSSAHGRDDSMTWTRKARHALWCGGDAQGPEGEGGDDVLDLALEAEREHGRDCHDREEEHGDDVVGHEAIGI
eukprot:1540990-Rhodomonas_salina.1